MRYFLVFAALLALSGTAVAEQLPNKAVLDKSSPQHGPGKSLSGDEMSSLYLQSPQLVSTSEAQSGMDSVTDQDRYVTTDMMQRDKQQQDNIPRSNTAPPPPPTPPANPMLLIPLLQLLAPQQ